MNSTRRPIQYPMAINEQGQLVSATLAPSNKKYICIDCLSIMVVHKGPKLQHHFQHLADTTEARNCQPESAIHKAGKRILKEKISQALIENTPVYFVSKCPTCLKDNQVNIIPFGDMILEETNLPDSRFRPDLTLYSGNTPKLAIEIVKTNAISQEKAKYLAEIQLPAFVIEVDVSDDLMSNWENNIIAGYFAYPNLHLFDKVCCSNLWQSSKKFAPALVQIDIINECDKIKQAEQEQQTMEKNLKLIKDNFINLSEYPYNDYYQIDFPKIWELPGIGVICHYNYQSCYVFDVLNNDLPLNQILNTWFCRYYNHTEQSHYNDELCQEISEVDLMNTGAIQKLIIHNSIEDFLAYHIDNQTESKHNPKELLEVWENNKNVTHTMFSFTARIFDNFGEYRSGIQKDYPKVWEIIGASRGAVLFSHPSDGGLGYIDIFASEIKDILYWLVSAGYYESMSSHEDLEIKETFIFEGLNAYFDSFHVWESPYQYLDHYANKSNEVSTEVQAKLQKVLDIYRTYITGKPVLIDFDKGSYSQDVEIEGYGLYYRQLNNQISYLQPLRFWSKQDFIFALMRKESWFWEPAVKGCTYHPFESWYALTHGGMTPNQVFIGKDFKLYHKPAIDFSPLPFPKLTINDIKKRDIKFIKYPSFLAYLITKAGQSAEYRSFLTGHILEYFLMLVKKLVDELLDLLENDYENDEIDWGDD